MYSIFTGPTGFLIWLLVGIGVFYCVFIAPISRYLKKQKELRERTYIIQANHYIFQHNLKPDSEAAPGSPEYRRACAELNAAIRKKIKNGEILPEELPADDE
ncbi:MAG: hypothetical protein HFI67_12050 [Lachnospiraceae bacterium]|jgi:hypothetical protein|nr:hypothetical protein [Lachnospiraceae bacterium]